MKEILVSAVIPAHNEELHIANCIDSLLSQSYGNIEIMVVENGNSVDKTLEIAKAYEKKYKNVHALTIPGKQRGPGNAWNLGIRKSKGSIIVICGADLIYGKDYVRDGVNYLLSGKSPAISHNEERCNNPKNLWARAFFYKRRSVDEKGLSKVFYLVKKDYILKRPFNPELGYADDQTIYRTEGTKFPGFDLEIYHTNPASLKDTWEHSLWVGKSLDTHPLKVILLLPFFPIYSVYKTIQHLKNDFYSPFIFFLPFYYSIRYFAYFKEAIKKLVQRV
jgi:glycosyltransferase involved in cell wall biosynthesis